MTTQKPCERATVGPSISPYISTKQTKSQQTTNIQSLCLRYTKNNHSPKKKNHTAPVTQFTTISRLQNMIVMVQIILLRRASHPLPIIIVDAWEASFIISLYYLGGWMEEDRKLWLIKERERERGKRGVYLNYLLPKLSLLEMVFPLYLCNMVKIYIKFCINSVSKHCIRYL